MNKIPFIISTSDHYHHLLRINIFLFSKNWTSEQEVEIVGYKRPDFDLPVNFTFYSLGEQIGGPENFGADLRKYFENKEDFFIWAFDDTAWIKVDFDALMYLWCLRNWQVGRMNLCSRATKLQKHYLSPDYKGEYTVLENTQKALYRLCTQPSIWSKEFLLKYLNPGLSVWRFETQPSFNDGYRILGLQEEVVTHTELVTKHNIWKLNLHGIPTAQIHEMEDLGILTDKMEYERIPR